MLVDALCRLANSWTDEVASWGSYAPLATLLSTIRSRSGVNITPTKALTISAFYRGVNLVSNDIAVLPMFLYERTGENSKRIAQENPVYRLLHDRPNPYMTPFQFKKLMVTWAMIWGAGRAEIQLNGSEEPIALWPIDPTRCQTIYENGRIWHRVFNADGGVITLPDSRVLHYYLFSLDGLTGVSVIGCARNSLGLSVSAEDYAGNFFANNATPSGVLEFPGNLGGDPNDPKILALRRAWASAYSGDSGQGVMILEDGMKFTPLSMPHKDAQFLETRQFQVVEVARWLGVAPHLLFDLTRATFSNIEWQALEHDRHGLMPWCTALEEQCELKLLPEGSPYFCEFQMDALLRADATTRANVLAIKRRNGVLNANEWRALDNQNQIANGDLYLVPRELTTIEGMLAETRARTQGNATRAESPPPEPLANTEHLRAWLADILARMTKIHLNAVVRVAKKKLSADKLAEASDKLQQEHEARTQEAVTAWWQMASTQLKLRAEDLDAELLGFYQTPRLEDIETIVRAIVPDAEKKDAA
jgi:HK97 family phage portal protein